MTPTPDGLRIAVVHPWLVEVRGGEKAFFEMLRAFPGADPFLLFGDLTQVPADLRDRRWRTSLLQPFPRRAYRATLPLLAAAAESLPVSSYDVVVSSSAGWAHGVRHGQAAVHMAYVHSPPRYLWWERPPSSLGRAAAPALRPLLRRLRAWDRRAARRVTALLANSHTTASRIARCYGRAARVLHPPVAVERFLDLPRRPRGYALLLGELVPYKRVDRALRACALAGVPVKVVGDGPERGRLERDAPGRVEFLGRQPDAAVDALLSSASVYIHAGVEDFGIATVEAMAAGVPIAGINRGGTAEIVAHGGGILAEERDEALAAAIVRCLDQPAAFAARDEALRFGAGAFRAQLRQQVEGALPREAGGFAPGVVVPGGTPRERRAA